MLLTPPTPLSTPATPTQDPTDGLDPVAQPGPADKPGDQPEDTHASAQQAEQLAELEEKIEESDATVARIQAAIMAATGADFPAEDIQAILAEYSPEAIMEKVKLMGGMGKQELRNVPGLLRYLLVEDCRHVAGRARGKARAAPKSRAGNNQDEERNRNWREIAKTLNVT